MGGELVSRSNDCVGESPRWDRHRRCLWWVDNERATVHRHDPQRDSTQSFSLPRNASSLALTASAERLLATLPDGVYSCSANGQALSLVVNMETGDERCSFNDSGCDPVGRLWIGSGTEEFRGLGRLWLVSPHGGPQPELVLEGLSLPNGIGFSPDNQVMYLADSMEGVVYRIPYELETGRIGELEELFRCDEASGIPDGLAVDVEGCVWVAFWGGGCVRRYTADGQMVAEIHLPVELVAGCAFGGPGLSDLYVTTAWYGLSEQQRADQPLAGSLFRITVDTPGVPVGTVPDPISSGTLPGHDGGGATRSWAEQERHR